MDCLAQKIFLFSLFLIFHIPVSGQSLIDSFDIATYARPDLERRTKQLQPRFSNWFSLEDGKNRDYEYRYNLNLDVSLSTTKFINSQEYQIRQSNNYEFSFNFKSNSETDEKKQISVTPEYRTNFSKKFFKPDNRFLEIGVVTNLVNTYDSWYSQADKNRIHQLESNLFFSLPFYKGKGRIEIVDDAWLAVQILHILEQQQLIKRAIPANEIEDFANQIADIKNLRNTDARLERIGEYEDLVGFLVENKMVKEDDYRFFAYLIDAYQSEDFALRRSGREIKYGLVPEFNMIQKFSNETVNNQLRTNNSLAFEVQLNKYTPKNLQWQFDQFHEFRAQYGWRSLAFFFDPTSSQNSNFSQFKDAQVGWSSTWRYQYLPNQRTNYSLLFNMNGRVVYQFIPNSQLSLNRLLGIFSSGLRFDYNYYFSPQLRFSLDAGIDSNVQHDFEDNVSVFMSTYMIFSTSYFFY